MSKSRTYANNLLKLMLQAVPIANVADNAASSPLTNLYVALHTADPGETGVQTASEISYAGYARVAVARSAAGFAVADDVATFVDDVTFPQATGGTATATHFSIGTAPSGAGAIWYRGALSPAISVNTGVTPQIAKETTIQEQ